MDLDSIIAELNVERERISRAINALLEGAEAVRRGRPPKVSGGRRGGMSAEGRRRIALAMKRRWAERRAKTATKTAPKARTGGVKKGGGMTAAGRKRLSDLMKKRWAARKAKAKAS